MRILSIDAETRMHSIDYLSVAPGSRRVVTERLAIHRAEVDALPSALSALVVASDLQGREASCSQRLLGEAVAEELAILSELGELPPAKETGVIICGDMFSRPTLDRRGGSGDCRPVWLAFRDRYRWVCGVAGNHDLFSEKPSEPDFEAFKAEQGVYFFDGHVIQLDGLRIGGVSGIVGNPRKPFRREEPEYVQAISDVLVASPDILLLHDGPDFPQEHFWGWESVRALIEREHRMLTIRGHSHWPMPLVELQNGGQVLNADAQVFVLFPEGE